MGGGQHGVAEAMNKEEAKAEQPTEWNQTPSKEGDQLP